MLTQGESRIRRSLNVLRSKSVASASFLTLASIVGQVVSLLNLYLITKHLYSTEVFGHYSVFLSYSAMIGTVSLFSFEKAIPNISDRQLQYFSHAVLVVLLTTAVLCFLATLLLGYTFAPHLAILIAASGIAGILVMLNVRRKEYRLLVFNRVGTHLILLAILGTYFVWPRSSLDSLIWAYVGAVSLSTVIHLAFSGVAKYLLQDFSTRRSWVLLKRQFSFAALVTPSKLFNRAAYQLPVVLLERYFGAAVAGQYSVVLRLGFGPIGLIGNSLNQIYHGKLAELSRDRHSGVPILFGRVRNILIPIGIVTFLGFLFVVPSATVWLLGEKWDDAATFLRIFSPFFGIMICVAPLTVGYFVLNDPKNQLLNQFLYFVIAMVSFGIGVLINNVLVAVSLFSFLSCIRYGYMYFQLQSLHQNYGSVATSNAT